MKPRKRLNISLLLMVLCLSGCSVLKQKEPSICPTCGKPIDPKEMVVAVWTLDENGNEVHYVYHPKCR